MGISIANISPPPKAANTKVPTAKGSQHCPKSHLSVSSLHSRATETSSAPFSLNYSAMRAYSSAFKRALSSSSDFSINSLSICYSFSAFECACSSSQHSASIYQQCAPPLLSSTVVAPPPQTSAPFTQKFTSLLQPSTIRFLPPHPHPCFFRNARLLFRFQS